MKTVTMHNAKTHLSRLVDEALAGEEIVIARRDQPLVRLEVLKKSPQKRQIGCLPNLVQKMGDGFNDPFEDWDDSILPEAKP